MSRATSALKAPWLSEEILVGTPYLQIQLQNMMADASRAPIGFRNLYMVAPLHVAGSTMDSTAT